MQRRATRRQRRACGSSWSPPGSCTLSRNRPPGGTLNRSIESVLRFVNLTASGLLAGSLGFGEKALVPGWRSELPSHHDRTLRPIDALKNVDYFNAIGPLALGTAVTLAVAARDTRPIKRVLDAASAL